MTDEAARYRRIRGATESLCARLSPEDSALQSMPFASPAKWHLAHTSWFFETFLLSEEVAGYRAFHPDFKVLFNSYYETVGEQHPRPQRGLLSRPGLTKVRDYRRHVDEHMGRLLETGTLDPPHPLAQVFEVGLQHEQQHQELLLTDIKHLFSLNPTDPVYQEARAEATAPEPALPSRLNWIRHEGGILSVGHDGNGFAFDNERPRHETLLQDFELASRPVTNGEFQSFIQEGGYEKPDLWLSDGWEVAKTRSWKAPLYWRARDGEWFHFTLSGLEEVAAEEPVCHVSYYEADAFARWAGARLPREAEWEHAAAAAPVKGNFVESGHLHPRAAGEPQGENLQQLYGDVWEWTESPYVPYPGFRPLSGSLGEYNGKFMCNQMVLRGGSCASPASHLRPTYRNFFYPDLRWQFSGIRLARNEAQ